MRMLSVNSQTLDLPLVNPFQLRILRSRLYYGAMFARSWYLALNDMCACINTSALPQAQYM